MTYTEQEIQEMYDNMLNDVYGEVNLGPFTFMPAEIFKNCDPIAYRTGMSDFEDHYIEEEE